MSYVVLARKYRPMFFQDVVGQQHVTKTLQNAIEQNRIANAYLFSGPRGVGKTTVARLLAKALNCEHGPTIKPCNKCSSCIEINESRSLDVFEIDGASNRGIDEVRNLRESLRYSPNPGKHRIYIIDEVHMLTNEAFNALLKTLEEPPTSVLFIFATTEAHKVPATILSRCQRFDFKRMSNKSIADQLRELAKKENIEIDEESLRLITNKADGSMRDGESIFDQVIAFAGMKIHAAQVADLLGIIDQELFFQVTDFIKKGDVQGGVDLANKIFTEGYNFNEFLIGLAEHFRNILIAKATHTAKELDVSEEHEKRYVSVADNFQVEDLLRLVKIAADAENLIRRSSNGRLHLEVALVKMIKLTRSVQLSQLLDKIEDIKKKPEQQSYANKPPIANNVSHAPHFGATTPPSGSRIADSNGARADSASPFTKKLELLKQQQTDSKPEVEQEPTRIEFSEIENRWEEIVEYIKKRRIALGSFLSEGWPTQLEGRTLVVMFGAQNGFHIDSIKKQQKDIEKIIQEFLDVKITLRCVKDDQGVLDKVRKVPARVDKKTQFLQLIEENSIVKKIVDTFDAELID